MTFAIRWRAEDVFRESALRNLAWGVIAGVVIFLASPPGSTRLGSFFTGFPTAMGIASLGWLWWRGVAVGIGTAAAFAAAGAVAQVGWASFYGAALAGSGGGTPLDCAGGGAAVGLILSLGHLPRCLAIAPEGIDGRGEGVEEALRVGGHGELADLVKRACVQWQRVNESLAGAEGGRAALQQAMRRFLDEAEQFAGAVPIGVLPSVDEIASREWRVAELLEGTRDAHAREHLVQTQVALRAQTRHLADIENSRARALSHMHRYVAALERLHLAVLSQRSSDVSKRAPIVQPIIDDLVAWADDLDAQEDAHAEMDRGDRR